MHELRDLHVLSSSANHERSQLALLVAACEESLGEPAVRLLLFRSSSSVPFAQSALPADVSPVQNNIAWAWDNVRERLLLGSSRRLFVLAARDAGGPVLRELAFADFVTWCCVDAAGMWWCIAGSSLYAEPAENEHPKLVMSDVRSATLSGDVFTFIRGPRAGLVVGRVTGGELTQFPWTLPVARKPKLDVLSSGTLVVSALGERVDDRERLVIACLDPTTGRADRVFDAEVGVGLGYPSPRWIVHRDRIVLLAERAQSSQIVIVGSTSRDVQPLSPANVEVHDFACDPSSGLVAFTGNRIGDPVPDLSRALYVLDTDDSAPAAVQVNHAVSRLPQWTGARQLTWIESGADEPAAWNLERRDIGAARSAPAAASSNRKAPATVHRLGPLLDVLSYEATPRSRSAVICVQGPHRHFVDGLQPLYFHQQLHRLLMAACALGHGAYAINGSGSSGEGRGRRTAFTAAGYVGDAADAIYRTVDWLCARGVADLVVLAGSLAAMSAIAAARTIPDLAGIVLVSPTFSAPVETEFGNWDELFAGPVPALGDVSGVRAPVLVAHGLNDEVCSTSEVSSLLLELAAPYEQLTLPDEGHIFARASSWSRVRARYIAFLSQSFRSTALGIESC